MSLGDAALIARLDADIQFFHNNVRSLGGVTNKVEREVLVRQLVDSIHRVRFPALIAQKRDSDLQLRVDPANKIFDPLMGAVYHMRHGNLDEAAWLTFLFVHFGRSTSTGYQLARDVYGALGGNAWNWNSVVKNPHAFYAWLKNNSSRIKLNGGKFGNHRKYESIASLAIVFESYVDWVVANGGHATLFQTVQVQAGNVPTTAFEILYRDAPIKRFGRLARFDYVAMLGKLGITPVTPGKAFLAGSTGPLIGARTLLTGNSAATISASNLETVLASLDAHLLVGMQVLEDALCNWQKSPQKFVRFRG